MRNRIVLLALVLLCGCATTTPAPVAFAYTDSGSGPTVVLLHGHPQTQSSWRAVVPRLTRSFRVLVIDQRGQGASPAPIDRYDIATRAADVAALLRRLDVREAAVVGTDLGGQVGYALARDEPELVSRLACPRTACARSPTTSPRWSCPTPRTGWPKSTPARCSPSSSRSWPRAEPGPAA